MPASDQAVADFRAALTGAGVPDNAGFDYAAVFGGLRRKLAAVTDRAGDTAVDVDVATVELVPIVAEIRGLAELMLPTATSRRPRRWCAAPWAHG